MLKKICKNLTAALKESGVCTDEIKLEQVQYGFEILLSTLMSILSILVISLFLDAFVETAVFLMTFVPLRTYSGGYHASSHLKCFLILLTSFLLNVVANRFIYNEYVEVLSVSMIIFSFAVIFIKSPVADVNHPLSQRQIKAYKINSRIILSIFVLVSTASLLFGIDKILFNVSFGLTVTALSIIAVSIKNYFKKGDME